MELAFNSGDVIYVYGEMDEDGFFMGEVNGVRGLVPSNFLIESTDRHVSLSQSMELIKIKRSNIVIIIIVFGSYLSKSTENKINFAYSQLEHWKTIYICVHFYTLFILYYFNFQLIIIVIMMITILSMN